MDTYKTYTNNGIVNVSLKEYSDWLMKNASLYFIGPHITDDNREIYTAFTANSREHSCFTTFEVFLNQSGNGYKENIYNSTSWMEARDLHKKLLKVNKAEQELAEHF